MAAATSGTDTNLGASTTPRQRARPDALQGLNPPLQKHWCYISTENGPRIEDELVWQLARYWLGVERICLEFCESMLHEAENNDECLALLRKANYPQSISETSVVLDEMSKVLNGGSFHRDYLKQRHLLPYWNGWYITAHEILKQPATMLPEKLATVFELVRYDMRRLQEAGKSFPKYFIRSVQEGMLDDETQKVMREKWLVMDSMTNVASASFNSWDRKIVPWAEVVEQINNAAVLKPQSVVPSTWPSIMLWLAFSVTVISTIPTCAMGWRYSAHQPGSASDADFWFLLQNSCMGLLNLSILGVPLVREKLLSGYLWIQAWTWFYLVLGFFSALIAPVAYLYMPTEWSAYMSVLFGIIQVAVAWQIADQKSIVTVRAKQE